MVGATVIAVMCALPASPAFAHVIVVADHAEQGGFAVLTVRVPNESAGATTTSVQIVLPEETPLAVVRVKPHPGWKPRLSRSTPRLPLSGDDGGKITEVVTSVTWTAGSGAGIGPDQFEEFQLSAGPLPAVDRLVLTAVQTYDDGTVVRWDERSADGTTALDHPAPVLPLLPPSSPSAGPGTRGVGATGSGGHASGGHGGQGRPPGPLAVGAADPGGATGADPSGGPTTWLALAGLTAGVLGLVVAVSTTLSTRDGRAHPPRASTPPGSSGPPGPPGPPDPSGSSGSPGPPAPSGPAGPESSGQETPVVPAPRGG